MRVSDSLWRGPEPITTIRAIQLRLWLWISGSQLRGAPE